jgi:hypothetical protein
MNSRNSAAYKSAPSPSAYAAQALRPTPCAIIVQDGPGHQVRVLLERFNDGMAEYI